MSGPEMQANAIWTALHGLPLRDARRAGRDVLALLLLGALPALAACARAGSGRRRSPLAALGVRRSSRQVAFDAGLVLAGRGARWSRSRSARSAR